MSSRERVLRGVQHFMFAYAAVTGMVCIGVTLFGISIHSSDASDKKKIRNLNIYVWCIFIMVPIAIFVSTNTFW